MPRLSHKLEWIVPQSFRRWTNREGKKSRFTYIHTYMRVTSLENQKKMKEKKKPYKNEPFFQRKIGVYFESYKAKLVVLTRQN